MRRIRIEAVVGLLLALATLAGIGLGVAWALPDLGIGRGYDLTADFVSVGGLEPGAAVEIAGVPIGSVAALSLRDDEAHVVLHVASASVRIPSDSSAAIKTNGLIGERYVAIEPGQRSTPLPPGGRIAKTTSPFDLEDALAARLFGSVGAP